MQTPLILFLGDIGGSEVALIVVAILVFFGADKIPELARGLGKGIREFKDASTEIRREFEQSGQPTPLNHAQQPNYGPSNELAAPLPTPPATEANFGFDPGAAPTAPAIDPPAVHPYPAPAAHELPSSGPHSLPPNLAPEGTQPRQPYISATPDV